MNRRDKINYYLDISQSVLERGTCLRRNFGAIIVNNDEMVSTGYVGAPRGRKNCSDLGYCTREKSLIYLVANAMSFADLFTQRQTQLYRHLEKTCLGQLYTLWVLMLKQKN